MSVSASFKRARKSLYKHREILPFTLHSIGTSKRDVSESTNIRCWLYHASERSLQPRTLPEEVFFLRSFR